MDASSCHRRGVLLARRESQHILLEALRRRYETCPHTVVRLYVTMISIQHLVRAACMASLLCPYVQVRHRFLQAHAAHGSSPAGRHPRGLPLLLPRAADNLPFLCRVIYELGQPKVLQT